MLWFTTDTNFQLETIIRLHHLDRIKLLECKTAMEKLCNCRVCVRIDLFDRFSRISMAFRKRKQPTTNWHLPHYLWVGSFWVTFTPSWPSSHSILEMPPDLKVSSNRMDNLSEHNKRFAAPIIAVDTSFTRL